jgi:UDP-MurNAc hydroxylase
MKVHMIGHASLWVETQDARILMDPVLWDPFCEGLNETCPKREVIPEKLPEFDVLVISHQHLDHFDLPSLAYLPKHVDVFLPEDPLILDALQSLGYRNLYPLREFQKVKIGSTVLMTTRSEVRVPEFGMVFADPSGIFWNTVDTYFAPPTIAKVKEEFEQINFLLTTWHISLETKYQLNQDFSFPYDLYTHLFQLIQLVDPIAVSPGAQGWKYINEAAWQNQTVFPVNRERFCHDLAHALPQIRDHIYVLDPGDILSFDRESYQLNLGACDYVHKVIDDRELIEFCPVNVGKVLKDINPKHHDIVVMHQMIESAIVQDLSVFLEENLVQKFGNHVQWQVIYQLEVIFPNGVRKWFIDFSEPDIKIREGRHPLANYFVYLTASAFYDLIQANHDWDYLYCGGEYRQFHTVFQLTPTGLKKPSDGLLSDPISMRYLSQHIAEKRIQAEIAQLRSKNQIRQTETPIEPSKMINLGDILIRVKAPQDQKAAMSPCRSAAS